jgi:hypothetical protein
VAGAIFAIWVTGVTPIDAVLKDGEVQSAAVNTGCCEIQVDYQGAIVLYGPINLETAVKGGC